MRTVPPLIVSTIAATLFFSLAFATISRASRESEERSTKELAIVEVEVITAMSFSAEVTEPKPAATRKILLSDSDSRMLMKIAMAEAEGESTEGKALVMLVVLNRVYSSDFPDTVEEVIFQPKQFSPVLEGGRYYTTEPNEDCRSALDLVTSGWDESGGALYFESCEGDSWHSKNLELICKVGNHRLYR